MSSAEIPAFIGEFRIERLIGRGGFGTVYLGECDRYPGQKLAVKVFANPENASDFAAPLLDELANVIGLSDPRLVEVRGFGADTNQKPPVPFVAMDYVEGPRGGSFNLRDHVLLYGGKLPPAEVQRIFTEIGEGLAVLHDQGIAHLDLKPPNILLDKDLSSYVSDFGISRKVGSAEGAKINEAPIQGLTPEYASPEQVERQVGGLRSDIFALGIMLCECLTGKRPKVILLGKQRRIDYLKPSSKGLDESWDGMLAGALALEPIRRYRDARHFLEALQQVTPGESGGPTRMAGSGILVEGSEVPTIHADGEHLMKKKVQNRQRKWMLPGLLIFFICTGVVAGVALYMRNKLPTESSNHSELSSDQEASSELASEESLESEEPASHEASSEESSESAEPIAHEETSGESLVTEEPVSNKVTLEEILASEESASHAVVSEVPPIFEAPVVQEETSGESLTSEEPVTHEVASEELATSEAPVVQEETSGESLTFEEPEINEVVLDTPTPESTTTSTPSPSLTKTETPTESPTVTLTATPTLTPTITATPTPTTPEFHRAKQAQADAEQARNKARELAGDRLAAAGYEKSASTFSSAQQAMEENNFNLAAAQFILSVSQFDIVSDTVREIEKAEEMRYDNLRQLNQAREAWQKEDYPTAESLYQNYLNRKPSDASIILEFGEFYLATGNKAAGFEQLKRAAGRSSLEPVNRARIHAAFAREAYRTRNLETAIQEIQHARELAPEDKGYHDLLQQYQFEWGEQQQIEKGFGLSEPTSIVDETLTIRKE